MLELQPPTARVIRKGKQTDDNEETEVVIKVEEVVKGDLVRVRPGEKIPIDGIIVDGFSTVDQAITVTESLLLTSEPIKFTVKLSVSLSPFLFLDQ